MSLRIQHVSTNHVAQTWPLVESHLGAAQKFASGDYTVDQIKVYLSTGAWLLLVAVDEDNAVRGAATVLFQNHPNDRIAFITAMGGGDLMNGSVFESLCEVLSGFGATKIQGAMRPSMVRLSSKMGFEPKYTIVEAKI